MGAFTSEDIQAYQAHYAMPKRPPGYQSIRTSKKNTISIQQAVRKNAGVWCIRNFDSLTPSPRTGHCSVFGPQFNYVVVCYGNTPTEQLLNDFWYLDLNSNKWTQINVQDADLQPRTGARAVLIGIDLWIFGGTTETAFLNDLHVVNLQTGAVTRPQTTGDAPTARTNHIMAYNKGKIIVYSGSDVTVLSDMYILDVESLHWTQVNLNVGRSGACSAMIDNKLYIYGASQTPGFLVFDFQPNDGYIQKVSGTCPPSTVTNATLVPFDNYLLLIGGETRDDTQGDSQFAPIYVYDIEKSHWDIFNIQPDNVTTLQHDGTVDKNGNFIIPTTSQSTSVYNAITREISIFLGTPGLNPPNQYVIVAANALSSLHMQKDLLSMLYR
ncbi:Kelch motif family protein [Trichomonas vaginalis G3]|uniref:Kelch motif family protein n=1 Tax=Trichomonas vaginalis (strain ATCC PRA-98 / G3) TaxID=412133 RepID=A2E2C0_TRIV3|nr:nitrile biosynthetic process [Trichomonas vaginalis G3]EAY13220.1 Kelch motif family protein [Trichomonas vaginalis G3]KAI5488150.1 nitrile biosynthetic process [Trichomonas vaginalis G3]|eukprot:XP_001325443.1 Kelch motif family protein [Trichomonas vaginalis G3]